MKDSITTIWITIVVLILTYAALVYWGVQSYKDSSASIESILKPDKESQAINDLYKYIVQADLHFNNYILTEDLDNQEAAQRYMQRADSMLLQMKGPEGRYSVQSATLDSLKATLSEKSRINNILFDLKKQRHSNLFTEEALSRIKKQISDTAYVDRAIIRRSGLTAKIDTLEEVEIVINPDTYKGLSGFIRKLTGRERVEIDTIITLSEKVNYDLEVSVDSSVVRDYFVDTTLVLVENILVDVLGKELRLQRRLYSTELELINYNERLLRSVQDLLDDIASANAGRTKSEQELAKAEIESANTQFLIIAGLGIFLGFILLIVLIKDISKANLYKKNLEKEKQRAEELAAAKEIFLSKMSHEIRTPLHSIAGFTQLLDHELAGERQRKLLMGVSHANQYLNELINNILEQAKINAGTFRLATSYVYIPELCTALDILFQHQVEEQKNTFKLTYSNKLKDHGVIIDPVKLKQVLINLLSNAFKYTRRGEVLLNFELMADGKGHELKVEVQDSGTGIEPKEQEMIFKPFNQLSSPRVNELNGTGLGLSISKYIVDHFGGEIRLQSEPGKGSLFTLHIPVGVEPYTHVHEAASDSETAQLYFPIRVLAVEDDKWNAYLLENYLGAYLQELRFCQSAEQALKVLAEQPQHYDLVLTDLNLPAMDGKELFRHITEQHSIPIIALSAGLSKKDFEALIGMGFADALGKPFRQKDIIEAIDKIFASAPFSKRNKPNPDGTDDFINKQSTGFEADYSIFMAEFEKKVRSFAEAIDTDLKELGRFSHQMKSNLEQVGIAHLSERLQSIEVYAGLNNTTRANEEAKALLPLLETAVAQFEASNKPR